MYGVAELAGYRRRSYDLWQEMAGSWERGREVLWETTRPVSEWLVDRLTTQSGETILELVAGVGETGRLAAARLTGLGSPAKTRADRRSQACVVLGVLPRDDH
jgi:hypothetical protein